jgi:hypothetical protein
VHGCGNTCGSLLDGLANDTSMLFLVLCRVRVGVRLISRINSIASQSNVVRTKVFAGLICD